MENETEVKDSELATSEEMRQLYRSLAAVQTNTIFRIMRGDTPEEMKELATIEAKKLQPIAGGGKCPWPLVYNPYTRECE